MGFVTLAGNRVSLCLHMSLAILGLSIIVQQSHSLFVVVRLIGAGYLAYLGFRSLRAFRRDSRPCPSAAPAPDSLTVPEAFRQGFINNLLNPNVTLFFLSFFPQFTSPDLLARSPLSIGAVFFAGNTAWWVPLVFVIGMGGLRSRVLRFQRLLDLVFGVVFIGYGIHVAAGLAF